LDLHLVFNAFSIVLIDLILGGDNAVVIALAVRSLPRRQRLRGTAAGAACAVVLRVALTFFAAEMLEVRFVQLIGGALIFWIAGRLFADAAPEGGGKELHGFWRAIGYIVVADITMSLDNVLAIAAASHGNLLLLTFGLGLSIPFIVFTSNLLANLMERFPIIVYAGAAILGKVGAEMMLTDSFIRSLWTPSPLVRYLIEGTGALAIVAAGRVTELRRSAAK